MASAFTYTAISTALYSFKQASDEASLNHMLQRGAPRWSFTTAGSGKTKPCGQSRASKQNCTSALGESAEHRCLCAHSFLL